METFSFKLLRTSKLSPPGADKDQKGAKRDKETRTSIPSYLVELFNLQEILGKTKLILAYKIRDYPNILLLTPQELTRDEIISINKYFDVSENVQHFKDITVYINRPKTQFLLKFGPPLINYLQMEIDGILGYGILEIDVESGRQKAKIKRYLIVSCDLYITTQRTKA